MTQRCAIYEHREACQRSSDFRHGAEPYGPTHMQHDAVQHQLLKARTELAQLEEHHVQDVNRLTQSFQNNNDLLLQFVKLLQAHAAKNIMMQAMLTLLEDSHNVIDNSNMPGPLGCGCLVAWRHHRGMTHNLTDPGALSLDRLPHVYNTYYREHFNPNRTSDTRHTALKNAEGTANCGHPPVDASNFNSLSANEYMTQVAKHCTEFEGSPAVKALDIVSDETAYNLFR